MNKKDDNEQFEEFNKSFEYSEPLNNKDALGQYEKSFKTPFENSESKFNYEKKAILVRNLGKQEIIIRSRIKSLLDQHSELKLKQKKDLLQWIIETCNNFLIGVSLILCLVLFEIKVSFEDFGYLVMFLVFFVFFILYKILLHFLPNFCAIFKFSEREMRYSKIIIFLFAIIAVHKIVDIRNLEKMPYLPTIIITLLTSTTATLIGLPAIVAMAIYRDEKEKKKEKESDIFD
jgi:hypothetical protein